MRRMSRCSDVMPSDLREQLEAFYPEIFDQPDGADYSYGSAARWLLAHDARVAAA